MFWVSKVIAPLALVVGIAVATTMTAEGNQPPFGRFGQPGKGGQPGKDEKKTDRKDDKKVEKKDDRKAPATAKPDATVDAWVKVLIEKITDPHDTVRESARGALVGVGPPALPALQKLADGDDAAKAVAARKLIAAIQGQRGGDRGRGFGGPGGGTGAAPAPAPAPERAPESGRGDDRGRGFGPFGGFGPGGFGGFGGPGMGPGGWGRGGGGDRGRGPGGGRPGRGESNIEVAPMPREAR